MTKARENEFIRKKRTEKQIEEEEFRLMEAYQKKDERNRKKMEVIVKKLINSKMVTSDLIKDSLVDLDFHTLEFVTKMILDPVKTLVDKTIIHTWFDRSDTKYNGQVVKRKRKGTFVVGYWKSNESKVESEDYDVSLFQLVTDYIFGDLHFVD